jgi:TRAP-type mannitol/chloroaromatic compound transport system permease small subunit
MNGLLALSRLVDVVTDRIGRTLWWFVLAAVLISGTNAILRKAFNIGSNAWLEVQWYLFAAVFMLGAGYAFLKNAHVRIDFISAKLSARTRNWIDIVGIVVFLVPLTLMLSYLGWPLFHNAWVTNEMSQNAGGLIRWPVLALIPLGMTLLLIQALSELVKRIAFLQGRIPDPLAHEPHTKETPEQLEGEE